MLDRATIEQMSHEALVELVLKLLEEVASLRQEIDEIKRGGKRSATPFSKGKGVEQPKGSGRTPGEGPFRRRDAPDPGSYTSTHEVPIEHEQCPDCGGALLSEEPEVVTITDLPEMPKPEIAAYILARAQCACCHRLLRAEHPAIASDQRGATAHRLGNRVTAVAAWLHYSLGLPQRKLPVIFRDLFGLSVTQSAIAQAAERSAYGLDDAYEQLRTSIATSPQVNTDDTSWRVNGSAAYVMNFSNAQTVFYQITPRHRHQDVEAVIGTNYRGVLTTDRFRSYDAAPLLAVKQQKCLAHILRNLSEHLDGKRGRARSFALTLQHLLREALALWHDYHHKKRYRWRERAAELRQRLEDHLRDRPLRDPDNRRLLNELGWHSDNGSLLRFLDDPSIEPTNNRAERDLRGAVIARKISHCSKSWSGAHTRSVLMSICQTLRRRGAASICEALRQVIASGELPLSA
jgi:transposase